MNKQNKQILVIDDDKLVTYSLNNLLTKEGYSTLTSLNAHEALDKVIKYSDIDLIICDIRLPDINGFETARKIKEYLQANNKPDIPIIFIPGFTDRDLHIKAQELGKVLLKPFETKEFLDSIAIEIERIPHDAKLNYNREFVAGRLNWLSKKTGVRFSHIADFSTDPEEFKGNIENFIGVAQVPYGF